MNNSFFNLNLNVQQKVQKVVLNVF